MYCNKANANQLTALLIAHGIRDIVVCPGSRNGVLAHNFHAAPLLNAHPVTDERSAGFVALGLALATGKPAAVCVTSGSALLATLPAVSEAYFRHIPLIVISADRPPQWIGQMDGQTLPQQHALQPYADTYNIIEPQNETERWGNNRLINEALCRCREPEGRPVHFQPAHQRTALRVHHPRPALRAHGESLRRLRARAPARRNRQPHCRGKQPALGGGAMRAARG